jgi:hypothetical protein
MNSHWKAVIGVILIFVFGCFSGALCTSLFVGHKIKDLIEKGPDSVAEIMERRLTRNLDLDPDQKQKVHECFQANLKQRKELQTQIQPQVRMLNRQTFQEISAILRPDQADRFHQNVEELRKRRKGFNPGGPNSDPGAPESETGMSTNTGAGAPPIH